MLEDRHTDLAVLARTLGFGRLSFGSRERLQRILGVSPGAVTPFALINCRNRPEIDLTVALGRKMLMTMPLHYHPLHNEATIRLTPDDLLLFIRKMGFEPEIIDFSTFSS